MNYESVKNGLMYASSHSMPGYTGNEYNKATGGYNLHGGAKSMLGVCTDAMLAQCNEVGLTSTAARIKQLQAEFVDSNTKPSRRSAIAEILSSIADEIYNK